MPSAWHLATYVSYSHCVASLWMLPSSFPTSLLYPRYMLKLDFGMGEKGKIVKAQDKHLFSLDRGKNLG